MNCVMFTVLRPVHLNFTTFCNKIFGTTAMKNGFLQNRFSSPQLYTTLVGSNVLLTSFACEGNAEKHRRLKQTTTTFAAWAGGWPRLRVLLCWRGVGRIAGLGRGMGVQEAAFSWSGRRSSGRSQVVRGCGQCKSTIKNKYIEAF